MANYRGAIEWIAANDGAADTPDNMPWEEALVLVSEQVTSVLVADVWGKDPTVVGTDVLRARGFTKPRRYGGVANPTTAA